MAYRIQYTTRARRDLRRLPLAAAQKILLSLSALKEDPYSSVKKLAGGHHYPVYTHRIGDYRAIVTVQDDTLLILVLEIGHRSSIYRKY